LQRKSPTFFWILPGKTPVAVTSSRCDRLFAEQSRKIFPEFVRFVDFVWQRFSLLNIPSDQTKPLHSPWESGRRVVSSRYLW